MLTTAALILWLSMERDSPHQAQFVVCLFVCLCGVLFVLGHTFHYFNAILEMACHGKIQYEPGIGCTAVGALVSCGHWLSCLLAGPVLLFAAAVGFWLYCGDLTIIDWSILVELCLAAVGWWLIALLLTNLDDSVRVASPLHVVATALTMPWEFAGLTVLAATVFLGHLLVAGYAIGQLHVTPLTAFPLLWVCWSSGFYLTAFTFRRIGLTYYRAQQRLEGASGPEPCPSSRCGIRATFKKSGPANRSRWFSNTWGVRRSSRRDVTVAGVSARSGVWALKTHEQLPVLDAKVDVVQRRIGRASSPFSFSVERAAVTGANKELAFGPPGDTTAFVQTAWRKHGAKRVGSVRGFPHEDRFLSLARSVRIRRVKLNQFPLADGQAVDRGDRPKRPAAA